MDKVIRKRCWRRGARAILLGAAAAAVLPALAQAAGGGVDLEAGAAALAARDFDRAASILGAAPAGTARHHYLLGVALFEKTRSAVLAERAAGALAPDRLGPAQAQGYRDALAHFEQVVALDPGGPDAPDALFRAALLHDHGYLQRFDLTLEKYRGVLRTYPGTPAAEKARIRLEGREGLFKVH